MRKAFIACLVVLALTGCKRKLKLEGKVTGFKPGTDTLMLHVVSERGASVSCEIPGYGCERMDIGPSGATDVELTTQAGQTENKVHLKGRIGPAENAVVVDPAASMPPTVQVAFNKYIGCISAVCTGSIDVVPVGHITLTAPAGTLVEIGGEKLTVGADGDLDGAWTSSPAAKDQSLSKLFGKDPVTFGSTNLALTFPDRKKASKKFDLTTEGAATVITAILKKVASGPVLFPWETSAPAKGKAVLYCRGTCYVGADGPLADLRVVALSEDKGERKTTCSYVNKSTGKPATANLTMHDELATAYDRATGKKLGTKVFQGSSTCDWEVTGKAGTSLTDQSSYPSGEAMAKWAASFAR